MNLFWGKVIINQKPRRAPTIDRLTQPKIATSQIFINLI